MKILSLNIFKIFLLLSGILGFSQEKIIPIFTDNSALVLGADKDGKLNIYYFGKSLQNISEYNNASKSYLQNQYGAYNNAYTTSGTQNLLEPAITVQHFDKNRSTELKFQSTEEQKINDNVSIRKIYLKDTFYNFFVTLCFKTWKKENVIEQWTEIENKEKGNIILEKYASANLYFTQKDFYLKTFSGDYAREMQGTETKLTQGIKTIDSKLGTRAMLFETPNFILSFQNPAREDEGEVLLGQLAWSGNFKLDFEIDPIKNLRFIAGINPYSSAYQLVSGEKLITPSLIYTYSTHGLGEASRNLQSWAKNYRILDGNGQRLTLLNNWEATYFDFNEEKIANLLKGANEIGVDLFLLDDGWFGNKYPRNNDDAGLGDWQENAKKLPHGIGYLISEAEKNKVKFGIWIEPEMVNPRSELYEKHKDWVIKQPNRPEIYYRNQLVLDLANPEVQDFVYGIVDDLFTKNPKLSFIKWDCNAVIFNAYSSYLEKNKKPQTQLYVDYVKGLYQVLKKIRQKYPTVPMMLCSGGGGRADYEILQYFTEFWPSDETNPTERIFIQWNNSYFYPSIVSDNHITNSGNQSMKFKFDVASMGKLGFDIVVDKMNEKDKIFCKNAMKNYGNFKNLVWNGTQFRLKNPFESDIASLMYVDENQSHAIMFTYLVNHFEHNTDREHPIILKGLNPNKKYTIKEINLYPETISEMPKNIEVSGDYLMKVGIDPIINQTRTSVVLEIDELK